MIWKKTSSRRDKFIPNEFVIGESVLNEFYPLYAMFDYGNKRPLEEILTLNEVSSTIDFYYYKPTFISGFTYIPRTKAYAKAFNSFLDFDRPLYLDYKYKGQEYFLKIFGGCIMNDQEEVLALLCGKVSELQNHFIGIPDAKITFEDQLQEENGKVKNDSLFLLVSSNFMTEPQYTSVYRRFLKEVFLPLLESLGVEIITLKHGRIEEKVFKNSLRTSFDTFQELEEEISNTRAIFGEIAMGQHSTSSEEELLPF